MQIKSYQQDSIRILRISGNIDWNNSHLIKQHFDQCYASNQIKVILELADVEALVSSGVGSFMNFARELEKIGGKLALVELSEHVITVLSTLELLDFFLICKTKEEAIEKLKKL